jgi:hypothetical protein
MSTETYKMELRKQILVFVSVKSGERLEFLDRVLRDAGAEVIGPQAYSFRQDAAAPEAVASAAGDLDAGECIYILSASDGALVNHMLVPPRITGGIDIQRDPGD